MFRFGRRPIDGSDFLLFAVLLVSIWTTGCSGGNVPRHSDRWTPAEMGGITYEIPPDWHLQNKTSTSRLYTFSGTGFQFIFLRHVETGVKLEHLDRTVDGRPEAWELARLELMNFQSSPEVLETELLEQRPFSALGDAGYLMTLRVNRSNGFAYRYWIAGGRVRTGYTRIVIGLERNHQLSRWKETMRTVLRKLSINAAPSRDA